MAYVRNIVSDGPTGLPSAGVRLLELVRPAPPLSSGDSIARALALMQAGAVDVLAVVDGRGSVRASIAVHAVADHLAGSTAGTDAPVSDVRCASVPILTADTAPAEAVDRLRGGTHSWAIVTGFGGRYIGLVALSDLVQPVRRPFGLPGVGGLATPWGVHLTLHGVRAGIGNAAMMASGVLLGAILMASHGAVGLVAGYVQDRTGWPVHAIWASPQAPTDWAAIPWLLLQGTGFLGFLCALRALPQSAHHAAEHMVVHAMERCEPLSVQVVRRMPRVHPRCGTNLIAGVALIGALAHLVSALRGDVISSGDATLVGVALTLPLWRPFGRAIQHLFTTRPPTDGQLASAIAVADALRAEYFARGPQPMTLVRRLWCMGALQTGAGVATGSAGMMLLLEIVLPLVG